ncbi:MAG: hypothetical protein QGH94_12940, partial [Phycisphaerae bacterium]|nr:hypothetical protein [Phycisphaerae bacterium]
MTILNKTFGVSRAWGFLLAALLTSACLGGDGSVSSARTRKLIATGWDMPDTKRLRANLAEIESAPFDGIVLEVLGQR